MAPQLDKAACVYTSCYCEENVYLLSQSLLEKDKDDADAYHVVFISNPQETTAIWAQQKGHPVVWDYHVILWHHRRNEIYDLDSVLPFPFHAPDYLQESFHPSDARVPTTYRPRFRLIRAEAFVARFASDRPHMRDRTTGEWLSPPPTYPPLGTGMNLMQWRAMQDPVTALDEINVQDGYGSVLTLSMFMKWITSQA